MTNSGKVLTRSFEFHSYDNFMDELPGILTQYMNPQDLIRCLISKHFHPAINGP